MQLFHHTKTGGFSCSLWKVITAMLAVFLLVPRATSSLGNQMAQHIQPIGDKECQRGLWERDFDWSEGFRKRPVEIKRWLKSTLAAFLSLVLVA